jgi:glycosyltransferase involved in cell wall biosynthesis
MVRPLVSVIIPVYNGEKYLLEAIESVFSQTYRPTEIIVVDDGSTDNTAKLLASISGQIRSFYQSNSGPAAARNTGIHNSNGELISFLDADDYWAPNKLNIQVECLLKHPHIGYVLGMQRNFLESGTDRPFWLKEEHLLEEHIGFLPTLLIRKKIFQVVGLFNSDYRISSDVEWFSRVVDFSIPRMVVSELVLHRRIHKANLGYQLKNGNFLYLQALRASVHRKRMKGLRRNT